MEMPMDELQGLDISQLISQLQQPQAQGDTGALGMLTQLFQPQQAEAAAAPDPFTQQFKLLQQRSREQAAMRQQQQQDVSNRFREREVQLREQAQGAKLNPAGQGDLAGRLSSILGGPNEAPVGDVYITGKTPGTGTPFAGNQLPSWATPEMKADFEAQTATRNAELAKRQAAKPQGLDPQRLAKSAQLASELKKLGYPAETINLVLRSSFPELAEQKTKEAGSVAQAKSDVTLRRQQTMSQFNDRLQRERELDKPLSGTAMTQLQYGQNLQSAIDTIAGFVDANKHGEFVGPVAGRTYEVRRQLPGQVSAEESTMRLALDNAKDLLLRQRSGAAINEKEADRLANLLPKETDDPEVFRNSFNAFQNALQKSIGSGTFFATATKRQVQQQQQSGQAPSTAAPASTSGGQGKLANRAAVGEAMKQAGGDKRKALEILRSQGFTGAE